MYRKFVNSSEKVKTVLILKIKQLPFLGGVGGDSVEQGYPEMDLDSLTYQL